MKKRLAALPVIIAATVLLLVLPTVAAAAGPWWQVLDGSRPTNLWEPEPSVQEITTGTGEFFGEQAAVIELKVGGVKVGCLGTKNFAGTAGCGFLVGSPPIETAPELDAVLESAVGTAVAVEVTGGPVGGDPFRITASGPTPAIELNPIGGSAALKVINPGGSGRLILTLTNLGNAPVDGTDTPVSVTDELPEGAVASGVEAVAGYADKAGPIACEVQAAAFVTCTYEGILPPYEALEIQISVSLTGKPPVAGAPGKVTVSGGNAPIASASQSIRVSPEKAPFGIERFSSGGEEEGGTPTTQAGRYPFQLTTTIQLNSVGLRTGSSRADMRVDQAALPRNLRFPLPAGLVGNASAMPVCDVIAFYDPVPADSCPPETVIGVAAASIIENSVLPNERLPVPIFNLRPNYGEPARFGFNVKGTPVVINTSLDPDHEYRIIASVDNVTQLATFLSSTVVLWGNPSDPLHDNSRGWFCTERDLPEPCTRPAGLPADAFLRYPVSCDRPLTFEVEAEPWGVPLGGVINRASFTHDPLHGCNRLTFDPALTATPSSRLVKNSTGLDLRLDMPNSSFASADAIAEGQAKKVEVTLPEGVTVNPSQAEGLGVCNPSQYAQETFDWAPGAGCPENSKIGSVEITTPLLNEEAHGSVYVAEPFNNPFDSLLALYMVAKIPERGILVKQAGKVALDPRTGQLVTTFDDLPQIPFESFNLHFFGGNRAPLVMPSSCGSYDIVATFTPWHASNPDNPMPSEIVTRKSSFTVDRGGTGGSCPSGTPPFKPGFVAGTQSNSAGSYSPFAARLTRNDDEQEFTRFSMKLPKGVIGKLAGIPFCSDAAIASARARTGSNGGQEELDNPSCPAASQIGRTLVGAGVGPALTYAPGKIYLAGPYGGAKLSIVAITTAKVGPFDLGTVVIRQALKVDPETAEVTTDGSSSDPIPHILQGIVTHARDIRIFVDRDNFVLNPTNCERMAANASVVGSGTDFGSSSDDQAVDVSSPFQAADCASLGFKPKLKLSLRGGTKRGDTPKLKAVLTARKGDANIGRAQVTLPHSAFLEQAHIRTVCTRVQFRAGGGNGEKCPKASIYGRARAISPLLDESLVGPVYLRSSNHPLPDLVAALSSPKVDINLVGRIDSINGRIRNTFDSVPDTPVTKFTLEMQGGRKGLIVNSTNICKGKNRALANFKGQNGRRHEFKPLVRARCGKSTPRRHKR